MKKITLAVLLLLSVHAWAWGDPNPSEYTVNVHVSSSRQDNWYFQELNVAIDGKKLELRSEKAYVGRVLALGDYRARLVQDEHKATYDSVQVYEFLFPDKKTRRFMVVGRAE